MGDKVAEGTSEFRRGWTVILAAAVGVGLGTTGLPIYTIGQFILPLQQTFGWSRSAVAGGLLCLTIVGVFTAPVVGVLTERFGVRRVGLTAMLGLAAGYAGLTLNRGSLAAYYAGWTLLAVLGAGTSPIVWTRAVATWFDRQRGLALGLTLCGTGVVAMVGPGVVGGIIAAHGWQAGFWVLAGAQLVIGLPVVGWLFHARDAVGAGANPAAEGRGGVFGPGGAGGTTALPGITLATAIRGRQFWQFAAAFFLIAIVVGGMIVHLPAMLADRGIGEAQAGEALGWLGVAIIGGRLTIGSLLDRLPARLVAPVYILLPVISCLLLVRHAGIVPAVVLAGVSAGGEVDLLAYLVSRYFGMRQYPRIYGWSLSAFSAGVGLGPVFAGWVHDRTGRYDFALDVFIVLMVVAACLIAGLGSPGWGSGHGAAEGAGSE